MTGKACFQIRTSILSENFLLREVKQFYSLGEIRNLEYIAVSLNNTYRIETYNDIYYLRVYKHKWRCESEIQVEIDIMNYLHTKGVPVSVPIKKIDGSYIHKITTLEGERYVVIFTQAEGRFIRPLNEEQTSLLGNVYGQLHKTLDNIKEDVKRPHLNLENLLITSLQHIEPLLTHRDKDFKKLTQISLELKQKIEGILPVEKPVYGLCHGDLHDGNFRFDKNNHVIIFDFDCLSYSYRAYDLANYLDCLVEGVGMDNKLEVEQKWDLFIEGYREEQAITDRELETVKTFLPIRYIWLMGLHGYGSLEWGRDWLGDDYYDVFLGFIEQWIKEYKILS